MSILNTLKATITFEIDGIALQKLESNLERFLNGNQSTLEINAKKLLNLKYSSNTMRYSYSLVDGKVKIGRSLEQSMEMGEIDTRFFLNEIAQANATLLFIDNYIQARVKEINDYNERYIA